MIDLHAEKQDEKPTNESLYRKQMKMLKDFLDRGAISQTQYDKSARDLTQKMDFGEEKK